MSTVEASNNGFQKKDIRRYGDPVTAAFVVRVAQAGVGLLLMSCMQQTAEHALIAKQSTLKTRFVQLTTSRTLASVVCGVLT